MRVFVSYSHDSEDHSQWVLALATRLQNGGIDTLLDQWELEFGDDLPEFMESGIRDTDRVLVICTENYNQKANGGVGGVGYEKRIASAELYRNQSHSEQRKFIPIIRNVPNDPKVPTFLDGKKYLDMSDDNEFEDKFTDLIRYLYGKGEQKPALGTPPFVPIEAEVLEQVPDEKRPSLKGKSPAHEFSDRFSLAFPANRGVEWHTDEDQIAARLENLSEPASAYQEGHVLAWWRGPENMHIDTFKHLGGRRYLINIDELVIERIAAVYDPSYFRKWVYVEASADQPTGLYEHDPATLDEWVGKYGYYSEEYGLLEDGSLVTRAEYDDGATLIDGMPTDIAGRVDLRARYITPYNFVIAPHESPINNSDFDYALRDYLNELLKGGGSVEQIAEHARRLPRR